jgi:hypothetical protein
MMNHMPFIEVQHQDPVGERQHFHQFGSVDGPAEAEGQAGQCATKVCCIHKTLGGDVIGLH